MALSETLLALVKTAPDEVRVQAGFLYPESFTNYIHALIEDKGCRGIIPKGGSILPEVGESD